MYQKNPLIQFAGIPVSGAALKSCFSSLAHPEKKIQALEQSGELIRLKRNLYIVNRDLSGKPTDKGLCANHIYGPSYVSLHWALRYYGMIPERVYTITSATTKRSRTFQTPVGRYAYFQVPDKYFSIGIESKEDGDVHYLMASREKALCDLILHDNYVPNQSIKSLIAYLEEDMRLDMDVVSELDTNIIEQCARIGRKTRIFEYLIKIIKQ